MTKSVTKVYQILRVWADGYMRVGDYFVFEQSARDCALGIATAHPGTEFIVVPVELHGAPWPVIKVDGGQEIHAG